MAEKVKMILARPERTVMEGDFPGVIIPAFAGNLTVIPGRAPSMVWLEPGMVQLLDANLSVTEKFFVSGGIAEIVNDVCTISSEKVIAKKDISLAEAQEKLEKAVDESDKAFYQMMSDELEGFPLK